LKPIEFDPDAVTDANDTVDYYDRQRPGLGDDFRDELAAALNRIRQHPQMYPIDSDAIRICPLNRFPYSIVYEELDNRIWVGAVAHHARQPGCWSHRRPN